MCFHLLNFLHRVFTAHARLDGLALCALRAQFAFGDRNLLSDLSSGGKLGRTDAGGDGEPCALNLVSRVVVGEERGEERTAWLPWSRDGT